MAIDDKALHSGYNILNFMFYYVLGNTIHVYEHYWKKIPITYLLAAFLTLNILLLLGYCTYYHTTIGNTLYRLSFSYNSPVMPVNAMMFFMIILHRRFQSKTINWMATATLAIYLLHESNLSETYLLGPITLSIREALGNDILTFLALSILAVLVCVVCILIDHLLSPLWSWFAKMGEEAEKRLIIISKRPPTIN